MAIAQQDLQRLAGQLVLPLDGLVAIGIDAQGDGLRLVARLAQLCLQALGQIGLGDQLRLEVDPRRQIPIGMGGPGEAVDAGLLCIWNP